MAEAEVTGSGVLDMKMLAARLKEADPALKRELRRNFRAAANPVAQAARDSILSMPSHHDGTLRREVAKTITVRTSFSSAGVRVQIDSLGSKMPPGKGTLPQHLDSDRGWNHPVYGRPEPEAQSVALQKIHGKGFGHGRAWTWVKQFGRPGWFEGSIADNAREFRDAALKAIEDVERKLGT